MDYTSLVASKGTAGSILNWVGYGNADAPTLLTEAQALIYQSLRSREMRKEWVFGVSAGQSSVALPSRFLDPEGPIKDATNNCEYTQIIGTKLKSVRVYEEIASTVLGTDPFTTTINSGLVTVTKTAHGINQDSIVTISGASSPLNGIVLNGTFPVDSVTDANNFVIDTGSTLASASGAGGGAAAAYTGSNLVSGSPIAWSIWDEKVKFDFAFDAAAVMKMPYYRQPDDLSAANPTNFLTIKYPKMLRVATLAAAAEYMRDSEEYDRQYKALQALTTAAAITDDFGYRGASFGTENP